ncbi:MAG: hypothetical protein NC543_14225 [bacterium]|nr:hypothetical protein [bacterium]MCM1376221.1 hypothetical protein [Muribaculum sp.]
MWKMASEQRTEPRAVEGFVSRTVAARLRQAPPVIADRVLDVVCDGF